MSLAQPDLRAAGLQLLAQEADALAEGLIFARPRPSPDLQGAQFVSYWLKSRPARLAGVVVIPVLEQTQSLGTIGVEIVSPARQIVCQSTRPLSQAKPYQPLRFGFRPIAFSGPGWYELRVFAYGAKSPIHILEQRLFSPPHRWRRWRVRPVCGLIFSSTAEPSGTTLSENGYAEECARVAEVWGRPPAVKSLWQSKLYYEDTMRRLTHGSAPHYMNYIKNKYLPHQPAQTALSIGCGTGALERQGYEAGLFKHCLGLDVSAAALETARGLAHQFAYPLDYQVADLNHPDLHRQYEPFDLIFSNASLHHIDRLERLFAEIDSVLKPDGLFFFHEYVGPSRFQWKPKTLEIANRILQVLPERLHPGVQQIRRMTYEEFVQGDPSEAIHSEEIVSLATMFFDLLETTDGGTTLAHPLLNNIIRHFDEDDETEAALLRLVFLFEAILIEEGVLTSDYKLVILRKRGGRLD